MNFLERSTALLDRGFSVIPIEPNGKRPLGGFGATKRTRDLAVVESWAQQFPDANVGIVADENIIILESDDVERLYELIQNGCGQSISKTMTAMACGSSEDRPHFFFKRTEKASNVGNLAVPGLFEARFSNQYVVGPGSVHPSGATYRWLNSAPLATIPDWLVSELLRLAGMNKLASDRVIETVGDKVPEGSRHYFLMREAGKMWTGKIDESEFVDALQELNLKHCDPPRSLEHVIQCVRDVMRRDPYDAGPAVVLGGKALKKTVTVDWQALSPEQPLAEKPDFIVPPHEGTKGVDGWFVRGEVSLVVGSSGSGKSTIMYQLLEQLRQGEPFFKHPAAQIDYRILSHDRSLRAFNRTARRLQLSPEAQNRVVFLDHEQRREHPANTLMWFLKQCETNGSVPDLVFIEGMDMWVPNADVNNFNVVQEFLTALIDVATTWNVAIVGSVGSPKQKAKDKYTLQRDQVLGTIAWGRKAETIVYLELSDPEDPNSPRRMTALLRNGPAERFNLAWVDGRLEPKEEEPKDDKELEGVAETQKIDKPAMIMAYIESQTEGVLLNPAEMVWFDLSRTQVERILKTFCDPVSGLLTPSKDGRKNVYIVTKQRFKQPHTAQAEISGE